MKYLKSDYPFTIIYEDKISVNSGKAYTSMSIGLTSVKNREATDPKEKYETKYVNFFDPEALLKLSALCTIAYAEIKEKKSEEKKGNSKPKKEEVKEKVKDEEVYDNLNDEIPFN